MFNAIVVIIMIALAFMFWPWVLGFIILWIAFSVWRSSLKKSEDHEEELTKAQRSFNDAMGLINGARIKKTAEEQAKTLEKAEKHLFATLGLDPNKERVNADEGFAALEAVKIVLPVEKYIEAAYRAEFKKDAPATTSAYRDALYEIEMGGVTDEDFQRAGTKFRGARKTVTVAEIRSRAAL